MGRFFTVPFSMSNDVIVGNCGNENHLARMVNIIEILVLI